VRAMCAGDEAAASRPASAPGSRAEPVLPGRPVASGEYELKRGWFPAGAERFRITEDDAGFHMWISYEPDGFAFEPKGGLEVPSATTVEIGRDLAFKSATWRRETKALLTATYVLEGSTLKATARRPWKEYQPRSLEVPASGFVMAPGTAADFAALRSLKLEPGQKRSVKVVCFGFPDWSPEVIDTTFERFSDTTLDLPGRGSVPVSRFRTTFETPKGSLVSESWLGPDGVPVKTSIKSPEGKIEAILKKG
jgi:hypothetical protein